MSVKGIFGVGKTDDTIFEVGPQGRLHRTIPEDLHLLFSKSKLPAWLLT